MCFLRLLLSLRPLLSLRSLRLVLQPRRLLDDLREHRARFAALCRPMRRPDRGRVASEDVLEVAVALHAPRRERDDVDVAGPVVAMFDEEPAAIAVPTRAGIPPAGAHEHPRSLQLVAVERELEIALLQRGVDVVGLRRPRADVPQHDDAGAVAFGNHALEFAVRDRMILGHHREPLRLRIERRPFRNGPRQEDAVVLEPEVVVEMAGEMLLDAEETFVALRRDLAFRLRGLRKVPLAFIFLESHSRTGSEGYGGNGFTRRNRGTERSRVRPARVAGLTDGKRRRHHKPPAHWVCDGAGVFRQGDAWLRQASAAPTLRCSVSLCEIRFLRILR